MIPFLQSHSGLTSRVSSIFANNEPGVWFDPSDLSTMFQDAAGTVPVTAVEQPVGLMLDKSKGLVLGPELVVNGDFGTGDLTGWGTSGSAVSSVNNGVATITATSTSGILQTILNVGAPYVEVIATIRRSAGSDVSNLIVFGSAGFTNNVRQISISNSSFSVVRSIVPNPTGAITLYFQQRNTTIEIDNISVREIPGNHATQGTTTSRPVLSARVNLLTKTEQFGDGVWSKFNGSVSANSTAAPNGTQTADLFTENMVNGFHMVRAVNVNFASNPYRFSVFIKPNGRNLVAVGLETSTYATFGRIFDLATGTSTDNYGNAPANHSIQALDDGWFLLTIENTQQIKDIGIVLGQSGTPTTYQGDGTSGIYICGASLVPADQAHLPYQRVNTATDYDTAGFPHYLRCDGVDDFLVTPTITPGIDKVQAFAGVRKLSDALYSVVAELSTSYSSNAGAFVLSSAWNDGQFGVGSSGTVYTNAIGTRHSAPITKIVTLNSAISTDTLTLRVNGVQEKSSTADQGTGNFLSYPLYIGRRAGTTLPFNGHLYSLIVRFGSNLPIETIENTEKYINGLTKAY